MCNASGRTVMARFPDKPENCIEVATNAGSRWYADGWVRGNLGNLIVVGQPGIGKTETMTRTAGRDTSSWKV